MKLLLDTADIATIASYAWLIDGVTINPTLLARVDQEPSVVVAKARELLSTKTVHWQVTATTPEAVYAQAVAISKLEKCMVVKIPCIPLYYPVIQRLTAESVPVNATLIFSVEQAYLMARFGVHTVSLFFGRLEKNGYDALTVLHNIKQCLVQYGYKTQLLVASVHTNQQFEHALQAGADAITIAPKLMEMIFTNEFADEGFQKFSADWQAKFATRIFPEL